MADIIVRPVSDSSTTITVSKGFIGPPGRAATATVGTTTTGDAGSNASVTNVGTIFDAVFDFVIPKGDTGDAATIAVGTVTALNPDQNPTVTNSGTSGAAIFDFGLPNAATLDLGTVTIVNPDQNPSVTDVGTSGNVVLDINIPRAAAVAVQSAVTLTPDQNPSVADTGTNGDVNLTFSIPRAAAVNINPVTTVNPDVNPSVADTGVDGDVDLTFSIPRAAALDLGTITVVNPDQNPAITDVGTNGDAEFNFSLPRAATITLGTTNVLTPDQNPSVADTGTDGDALYTFSIPRAAVVSLGSLSVLNPDQNPTVTSTVTSGDIAYNFSLPRAADVSVGTVTQIATGSPPTVTDSGTNGDVVLDFGLPQGEAATINVGTTTVVNPDQNPSVTNVGTTSAAILDFDLPRASTFTVGTVTTGAAGTNVSITDIGTNGDVVLDFTIPRGDKGDKGDKGDQGDAATLDLGTVSVVNPNVNPSVTNVGSTSAAIFDIDLPRAASVSIGTVTTVEFDVSASVTNSGSNGDVILDFEIPRGTIGVDGAPGIVIAATEPENTDVLWADTSEPGENVLPSGGATGEYLVKSSASDFDAEWIALTSADVGLGNVPNLDTTDAVNTAHDQNTDTALDSGGANEVTAADARAHIDSTSNPHSVTKTQVGLSNVDNVSAADLRDRSTHTGTQTLLTISDAGTIASQDANNVNIDGGTINNTPIGGTTAAAGTFTTVTADSIIAPNVAAIGQFSWDNASTTTPVAKPQVTPSSQLIASIHGRMRGCLLLDNGQVNYYLNPSDWTQKADGSASDLTGADGMVMVEIPKFYVRNSSSGSMWLPEISATPLAGYEVHPAFIKDGAEVPYRYYSAYDACVFDGTNFIETNNDNAQNGRVNTATDKLVSVSGKAPMTGLTRNEFRLLAANRGDGWRIGDFALWSAIGLLLKVEAQSFDSQGVYGVGNTRHTSWPTGGGIGSSRVCNSGLGNSLGNGTGGSASGTINTFNNGDFVKYRGIENFWGNVWNWTDGIVLYSEGNSAGNKVFAYWNNNTDDFADVAQASASTAIPTGYGLLGEVANSFASARYATQFNANTVWSLVPTGVSTTGSHGTTDFWFTSSGWRVLVVGGSANDGAVAGAFAFVADLVSGDRGRRFGARLSY